MTWDGNGDIVVVLPGITGSVLQRDGADVFGLTAGAGLRALFSAGGSVADLALHGDPVDRPTLDDGVTASRIAPDAHLVPGLWKIDGYGAIGTYLRRTLHVQDGIDYREFPYDWRRDNRIAARRLQEESSRWLHERRRTHPAARLVLLAHSMGGLVARYFLEVLEGWRDTRTLVTFGTPHRGSPNALDYLVNGYRRAFGLVDLSALMRSFTSVHQLLPIYPCVRVDGGPLRRPSELGDLVPGLDPARVRAADEFHREIENAVRRNVDDEEYRTRGYTLHPVIGSEHRTLQSANWSGGVLTLRHDHPSGPGGTPRDMGGDGTVPRVSATPIEQSDDTTGWFSGTRHSSLQNAENVLLQIRLTLESPGLGLSGFRGTGLVNAALDMDDAYPAGEPPMVRVRPTEPTELVVGVEPLTGNGEVRRVEVPLIDDWTEVLLPVFEPGGYRVCVSGPDVEPTRDLFLVGPG